MKNWLSLGFVILALLLSVSAFARENAKSKPTNGRKDCPEAWKWNLTNETSLYNLFTFEEANAHSSDIRGIAFVGGRAEFSRFSIAEDANLLKSKADRADLTVVKGKISLAHLGIGPINSSKARTGSLYHDVNFLGWEKWEGVGIGQHRDELDLFKYWENIYALKGLSEYLDTVRINIKKSSLELSKLQATGKVVVSADSKRITLTGTEKLLNVFTIEAEKLVKALVIEVSAPQDSTVLVNVKGEKLILPDLGVRLQSELMDEDVLFNFYEATEISLGQVKFYKRAQDQSWEPITEATFITLLKTKKADGRLYELDVDLKAERITGFHIRGTVLAPLANLYAVKGVFDGSVIVNSYRSPSGSELHLHPFTGCYFYPAPK